MLTLVSAERGAKPALDEQSMGRCQPHRGTHNCAGALQGMHGRQASRQKAQAAGGCALGIQQRGTELRWGRTCTVMA